MKYAIATIVLTKDYEETAMAMCMSIRGGFDDDTPPAYVDLVAYVPEGAIGRGIDTTWLKCCFSRVQTLPSITVSQPPAFDQFKEMYVKLNLWQQTRYKRLLYLDADFVVIRIEALLDLLCHSRIFFGAVQDWMDGTWAPHWNGGLLVLEPGAETHKQLLSNLEPFMRDGRFNTNMAEQGYLWAYFGHLGFTLPTTYNLNMAMKFQAPEVWEWYVQEAVAVHFTWNKPWQFLEEKGSFPWSLWWAHKHRVDNQCPRDNVNR